MQFFTGLSILITLTAFFAYGNARFLRLPASIGLMLLALLSSLIIIATSQIYPPLLAGILSLLQTLDFSQLLMGSMLSFMLFAGAIQLNLQDLKNEKISITLFSTFSVLISTWIIGATLHFLLPFFGVNATFIQCLLFGSLISPTDPISVLGILKQTRITKSLETKFAGESLFNDGFAVVLFLTLLELADHSGKFEALKAIELLLREALGGVIWGIVLGYIGYALMRSIDNYKVEILITLSIVMGGYTMANIFHISGPLSMVGAGLIIGNQGKRNAMSPTTADYIDKFWELTDDILNALLFVLIGFEIIFIKPKIDHFFIGLMTILLVLAARYISIFIPALFIKIKEKMTKGTILLLTWGGLRGGISIALALSLKPDMNKNLWIALTYIIVGFSILVQGLTVGKLASRIQMNK